MVTDLGEPPDVNDKCKMRFYSKFTKSTAKGTWLTVRMCRAEAQPSGVDYFTDAPKKEDKKANTSSEPHKGSQCGRSITFLSQQNPLVRPARAACLTHSYRFKFGFMLNNLIISSLFCFFLICFAIFFKSLSTNRWEIEPGRYWGVSEQLFMCHGLALISIVRCRQQQGDLVWLAWPGEPGGTGDRENCRAWAACHRGEMSPHQRVGGTQVSGQCNGSPSPTAANTEAKVVEGLMKK